MYKSEESIKESMPRVFHKEVSIVFQPQTPTRKGANKTFPIVFFSPKGENKETFEKKSDFKKSGFSLIFGF